jgi:hypothetical protein
MAALARVQRLATSWVNDHGPELQGRELQEDLADHIPLHNTSVEILPFAYQVCRYAVVLSQSTAVAAPANGSAVCPALGDLTVLFHAGLLHADSCHNQSIIVVQAGPKVPTEVSIHPVSVCLTQVVLLFSVNAEHLAKAVTVSKHAPVCTCSLHIWGSLV